MAEYIERGAALVALSREGITRNMRGYRKVQAIPTADVAPVRHGRWILEPTNPYDDPGYKNRMIKRCSVCFWENACSYHYCPNCGAKMD